jgi:hypothetical protein
MSSDGRTDMLLSGNRMPSPLLAYDTRPQVGLETGERVRARAMGDSGPLPGRLPPAGNEREPRRQLIR